MLTHSGTGLRGCFSLVYTCVVSLRGSCHACEFEVEAPWCLVVPQITEHRPSVPAITASPSVGEERAAAGLLHEGTSRWRGQGRPGQGSLAVRPREPGTGTCLLYVCVPF